MDKKLEQTLHKGKFINGLHKYEKRDQCSYQRSRVKPQWDTTTYLLNWLKLKRRITTIPGCGTEVYYWWEGKILQPPKKKGFAG